jgi:hypothetical protein
MFFSENNWLERVSKWRVLSPCENIWPTWTLHLYLDVRTFGLHRPFIYTMIWEKGPCRPNVLTPRYKWRVHVSRIFSHQYLAYMDPSFIPWCENIWPTWTLHLYHGVRTFGLHGPFIYTMMWEHLAYMDPSFIPWCENIWPTWTLHLYHDVRTFGPHGPFIYTMWEHLGINEGSM